HVQEELIAIERDGEDLSSSTDDGSSRVGDGVDADVRRKHIARYDDCFFLRGSSDQMCAVLFVFADELDQVRVRDKAAARRQRNRFGVDGRILERDLQIEMAEVAAAEALRHLQRFAVRMSGEVEPRAIVEA